MGKASRRKTAGHSKALLDVTKSRLNALGVNPAVVIRSDLPQEQKISNAIGKILDSELSEEASIDEYRHRTNVIVLAWNVSLLPAEDQLKTLDSLGEFAERSNPFAAPAAKAELQRLIAKKQTMFPDDKRFIVSHDVQLVGSKVHITAAAVSAPPSPSETS